MLVLQSSQSTASILGLLSCLIRRLRLFGADELLSGRPVVREQLQVLFQRRVRRSKCWKAPR